MEECYCIRSHDFLNFKLKLLSHSHAAIADLLTKWHNLLRSFKTLQPQVVSKTGHKSQHPTLLCAPTDSPSS